MLLIGGTAKSFALLLSYIGEGFSGALEWRELMQLATEVGFVPPVLVKSTIYASEDPVIKKLRGILVYPIE